MKLHENKQLFKNAIDYIVQTHNLSTEIVVKDYYVTLALKMVYSSFEDLVFIGGHPFQNVLILLIDFQRILTWLQSGHQERENKGKQKMSCGILLRIGNIKFFMTT